MDKFRIKIIILPRYIIIAALLSISLYVSAQDGWEWAPVGATWTYHCVEVFGPPLGYICTMHVERDTIIEDKYCKIFNNSIYDNDCKYDHVSIAYYEDKKIYWRRNNEFTLIYNFALQTNDTLTIKLDQCYGFVLLSQSVVDSSYAFEVNNILSSTQVLKYSELPLQNLVNFHWVNEITGSSSFLFPVEGVHEEIYNLVCYSEQNFTLRFSRDNYPEVQVEIVDSCDFIIVGTEDIIHDDEVAIYPNPASEELFIDTEIDISSVALFDMRGKTLVHKYTDGLTSQNRKINVSNFPAGIYILKIMSERKYRFEKLVISH